MGVLLAFLVSGLGLVGWSHPAARQGTAVPSAGGIVRLTPSVSLGVAAGTSSGTTVPADQVPNAPSPPVLTMMLREHLVEFSGEPADPLFKGTQGRSLATITYRRARDRARQSALSDEEYRSPLARRPYDLRHACLSTWLNGGVAPTQVAEWAGHSVEILLRVYAKCLEGQDEIAKRRIVTVLADAE